MTLLTDIAIPFASMLGLAGLIWGAATLVRGHRAVDEVNSLKISANDQKLSAHDDECKRERANNAKAIRELEAKSGSEFRSLENRVLTLELNTKQDKQA